MNLREYTHALHQFVFEEWIDVPLEFEHMVNIVAIQFFNKQVTFKEACLFADLIIDIHTKGEFELVFEYEPFNVLDEELSDEHSYPYNPKAYDHTFKLIIDGDKRVDVHYDEQLTYKDLKHKLALLEAKSS